MRLAAFALAGLGGFPLQAYPATVFFAWPVSRSRMRAAQARTGLCRRPLPGTSRRSSWFQMTKG